MDITSKYNIVEKIIQANDDNLPDLDFWNDVPEELKQAIDQAKDELDRGEGIPHSQVMTEIKDRFRNK